MKRILFVVLAGVLMVPGAWAYSPGERAGVEAGAGGINACPVVGGPVLPGELQRMATDTGPLSTAKYPMSLAPVASCGTPPDRLAQIAVSHICRSNGGTGPFMCTRVFARPVGEPCCCYDAYGNIWFCGGVVSAY